MPSPFTRKFRSLLPRQQSELTVINADGSGREVILVADEIIEAPNWHLKDRRRDDSVCVFSCCC